METGRLSGWIRHQTARAFVQRVRDEAEALKGESEDINYEEADITEHLAVVLAAEMGQAAFAILQGTDNPQEHWRRVREVLHEFSQFRRHIIGRRA